MSAQSLHSDSNDSDAQFENTVTNLIGLNAYTTSGVYLGEVSDVQLDFTREQATGVALQNLNQDVFAHMDTGRQGVIIPYRWVRAAHDVVLVMDIVDQLASPE